MRIFGLYINRDKPDQNKSTFSPPENRDGALEVNAGQVNFSSQTLALDGTGIIEDEVKLITKYRELALQTEIDEAVQDIINEAFSYDDDAYPVEINLDEIPKEIIPEKTKDKIRDEFRYILNTMNFKQDCYEIFRNWYVDGRIFYEMVVDKNNPKDGIVDLKRIDSRTIKKVVEITTEKAQPTEYIQGMPLRTKQKYYYLYNRTGIGNTTQGLKVSPDQIAFAHSGILDKSNKTILSYLHAAIRPYNQYMNMKNSMVIYYHTRAPERRVFNIEVGMMPTGRVNQYMQEVVAKHRRKETYDPNTGAVGDEKRYMTMNEDLWFPKRDGKGTDVNVLSGGANLQEINDVVDMYKNELYRSLRLPASRYKDGGTNFNLGRSSEISRDELKFQKFITRIRKKFSVIFDEIIGTHLILKGILTAEEWDSIVSDVTYNYLQDSHFTELKNAEIWSNRINNFRDAEQFIGTYFSKKFATETFLNMTEEEWDEMKEQIKKEHKEDPPIDEFGNPQPGHPEFGTKEDPDAVPEEDDEPEDEGTKHTLKIKVDEMNEPSMDEKVQFILEHFDNKIKELENK